MKPTIENPDSPLMTRKEAARYIRVSDRKLQNLPIDCVWVGHRKHYTREMLDAYIQENTKKALPKEGLESCPPNTDTLPDSKAALFGIQILQSTEKEYEHLLDSAVHLKLNGSH